jgi:DNA-directed RNA polymerase specialized sigma24 family protein
MASSRAWVAAPDLTGILQPRAWLYRIATRVALDAIRHRGLFDWLPLSHVGSDVGEHAAEAWRVLPPNELGIIRMPFSERRMAEALHHLDVATLRHAPEQEIERLEQAHADELASYVALQSETS